MRKEIKYLIYFAVVVLILNWTGQKILLHGINKFYGLNQYAKVLILDSSRLMLAIDKEKLEENINLPVAKYTREGVSVYDKYFMLKQVLDSKYGDSIQVVLYGVDQFSFAEEKSSENAYKLFYPFMDEPVMDEYIRENASDWRDYYSHKYFPLCRYTDQLINASIRGWFDDYSNKKHGILDIEKYRKGNPRRDVSMQPDLVETFKKTMNLLLERNIRVILITAPIVDTLNEYNPENRDKVIRFLEEYAADNNLIEYWNFNPELSSDYKIFFDPTHLNPQGQEFFTQKIINKFKSLP
ncbi:SGNH/GDSL hydrolase family protein [Bacteroidales bacterium OttesenSCG-928-A17]|nr:SGNH/GDSL hydrolase family protein [Bacteroidales bacterium OttesenSCG-928-A17]